MTVSDNLTVALVPLDISQADKEANLQNLEESLKKLPAHTDIVVVPELFSTGYIADLEEAKNLAEREDGDTIERLKKMSKEKNTAICGSFLSRTGHMLFNRAFFVEPSGEVTFYDKRHLFCISEESKICHRGISLPPVVRYRRWNVCMAICYDVRFPEWLRNKGCAYDILLIPANWPDKRAYAWKHLLIARAIENQCYVAGCNRNGSDQWGTYSDSSYIFDYTGHQIGNSYPDYTIATFSKDHLIKYCTHFPVWKDADEFSVKLY